MGLQQRHTIPYDVCKAQADAVRLFVGLHQSERLLFIMQSSSSHQPRPSKSTRAHISRTSRTTQRHPPPAVPSLLALTTDRTDEAIAATPHESGEDSVHEQLRHLKAENTLLGSIIQQLQLDRQNRSVPIHPTASVRTCTRTIPDLPWSGVAGRSHLVHESSTAHADLNAQFAALQSDHQRQSSENSEMKDALVEVHKQLEEQQTAHRVRRTQLLIGSRRA
jgi:hypothetical protein